LQRDTGARVRAFAEKPAAPAPLPERPTHALVNMGVYVFRTEALVRAVIADAKADSKHDFGHDILPAMLGGGRVCGYDVTTHCPPAWHYWQDVGTLDSYFDSNMALLLPEPPFDLFDTQWPVRTYSGPLPPALIRNVGRREARAVDSIVSPGCVVSGANVVHAVLSPRVLVEAGAIVEEAILLPGVRIGAGACVRRAIIDEDVCIPPDTRIGGDGAADTRRFAVTPGGVQVVPQGTMLE